MTPIDIQVKGQAYSLYVGEGGISVLQTSIFLLLIIKLLLWQNFFYF